MTMTLQAPSRGRAARRIPPRLDYSKLVGKVIEIETSAGWHRVRVARVTAGPKMGLRSLRVASSRYEGRNPDGSNQWSWRGTERTLHLDNGVKLIGVAVRRKVIPVEEFCATSARKPPPPRSCRVCGCTDDDCLRCIKRTGEPCYWVEPDLCSACAYPSGGGEHS